MRPDRANFGITAPFDELLTIMLRQFKRPFAAHNIELSDADAQTIAAEIIAGKKLSDKAAAIRAALIAVIVESESVLAQWELTFTQALETGMDKMPGWETTAEFLDIANEKANAELRISTGAALVAALGDMRYAAYLLYMAERDDDDVDTAVSRRILAFRSGVDLQADDWLARIKQWVDEGGLA
jgi:hypothetical protein